MDNIEAMKQLLKYNPETGVFTWSEIAPTKVRNKVADAKDALGYVCLKVKGKMYKAHRIAWAFVYGEWPVNFIDHINGNPSDNRICNLRDVTHSVNIQNEKRHRSNNKSGFLGVSPNGAGWRAEIRVDGKKLNLGTYTTPEEASAVYKKRKLELHEGAVA